MKRLFEVDGKYFESKAKAKDQRNHLRAIDKAHANVTVKLGPDHWRYRGAKK